MRWLDSTTESTDMNLSKLREIVEDSEAWHAAVHGVTKSWTRLNNWTTKAVNIRYLSCTMNKDTNCEIKTYVFNTV